MIIDCHGHYTTAPAALQKFRDEQIAGLKTGIDVPLSAQTKISDDFIRQILPGGIFSDPSQTLNYYNLSVGYNILPGEVFFGSGIAKASAGYVVLGVGSTKFASQSYQTFNVGAGLRLFLNNRVALQVDMRDYIYSVDLLGKRQSTQNLEFTGGVTFFF